MTVHYFLTPETPEQRTQMQVELRGRTVSVVTSAGVFSPKALDKGTAVLLDSAPDPAGSEFLDLGCGWGPITLALGLSGANLSTESTDDDAPRVTAVDVNERSLALTRDNAAANGVRAETYLPEDVPAERRFDVIWSNPPIRVGKEALHQILLQWLPRLSPDGVAWLVVQKNLGADSLQKWLVTALAEATGQSWDVKRSATSKGFRVLAVSRKSR
ncbi:MULTISPECIES: class I SAM-dependent methyltransferase [Kocuria]|uniref:Methyltransferase n=1 Tax=Kocuria subflava TaxID=1736139 RepID=A0A846TKH3_9MICC|nr:MULTISPECIES: methyltransferase [Kocuria]NKE09708.1 methyltransferase [Kocuria subflava]